MWYPSDVNTAVIFHFLENQPVMYFLGEKNAFTHRGKTSTLTLEKRDHFLNIYERGENTNI